MIIFSIFLQWSNVLGFGEIGMERKNYRASVKVLKSSNFWILHWIEGYDCEGWTYWK